MRIAAGRTGEPEVFLLKPGTIRRDRSGRILDAISSVTLIVAGEIRLVVDTARPRDAGEILQALRTISISPEQVTCLVNTHSHPDHCGNNHLFSRAARLRDGDDVAPGVWIMATPGHTTDSISVVVEAMERVVVAGDALPTYGNFLKRVPPAIHIDRAQAVLSMERILELADLVVPGHDRPFHTAKCRYL